MMSLTAVTDRFCDTLFYVGAVHISEKEVSMKSEMAIYE